nr:hypothetical protein CFP56_74310 [Quercus suber]
MPAPADVQAATLQTFMDAWTRWDATEYLNVLDRDFTQVMMPCNMEIPPRSLAEVKQVLPTLMGIVKNFDVCGIESFSMDQKTKELTNLAAHGSSDSARRRQGQSSNPQHIYRRNTLRTLDE